MLIYLIRHAQEDLEEGDRDGGITNLGLKQSLALANSLKGKKIRTLLASDLPRAYETAAVVGGVLGLKAQKDAVFQEIKTPKGAWSKYVRERHPDFTFHPGGGESISELLKRADDAWEAIRQKAQGQDLAAVCHSIFIKALLYNLGFKKFLIRNDEIANTGIVILKLEGREVELLKFNSYSHLMFMEIKDFVTRLKNLILPQS